MPDLAGLEALFIRLYLDRHIMARLAADLRDRGYDGIAHDGEELLDDLSQELHASALGVRGTEIKPPDTREGDRGRAHGAGLERHVEVAVGEPRRALPFSTTDDIQ